MARLPNIYQSEGSILLNQNNDHVGTCAIITEDFSNNNNAPTRKVLTAAHKVKDIGYNE